MKRNKVNRNWGWVDAKGKILGRMASEVAYFLMGKNKPSYTPYLDMGDYVVVINAKEVVLSGKKESQKKYYHHSQYPGGLKIKTASQIRQNNPQQLVMHAVVGMMPKTKLAKIMLKKLFIYPNSTHPYTEKFILNYNHG